MVSVGAKNRAAPSKVQPYAFDCFVGNAQIKQCLLSNNLCWSLLCSALATSTLLSWSLLCSALATALALSALALSALATALCSSSLCVLSLLLEATARYH